MTIELYDQEEVLRSYVESERYEAAEEAENLSAHRYVFCYTGFYAVIT